MIVDVVLGLQYGDEGKGKVTHYLANRDNYDYVLRFNGGGNAGHTIYHNGKKIITHHIPSGVLHGIPSIIGPNCVLNPRAFFAEIEELENAGIDCRHLIKIAHNCHVITQEHVQAEHKESRVGTTRTGNGPAYTSKYNRTGTTAVEVEELKDYVIDFFATVLDKPDLKILAEGAQGFGLDIDFGDYPYVTSSHVTLGGVLLCGFSPKSIRHVYGVAKVYETYVGAKEFQDYENHNLAMIADVGQEYGATTGRLRKVNYLSEETLYKSIKVNHPTHVVLNKLDILRHVDDWKIVNALGMNVDLEDEETFCAEVKSFVHDIDPAVKVIFSSSPNEV